MTHALHVYPFADYSIGLIIPIQNSCKSYEANMLTDDELNVLAEVSRSNASMLTRILRNVMTTQALTWTILSLKKEEMIASGLSEEEAGSRIKTALDHHLVAVRLGSTQQYFRAEDNQLHPAPI